MTNITYLVRSFNTHCYLVHSSDWRWKFLNFTVVHEAYISNVSQIGPKTFTLHVMWHVVWSKSIILRRYEGSTFYSKLNNFDLRLLTRIFAISLFCLLSRVENSVALVSEVYRPIALAKLLGTIRKGFCLPSASAYHCDSCALVQVGSSFSRASIINVNFY